MILNCKTSRLKLRLGVSNLFDTVTIPRQIRVEEFEIKGAKRRHVMLLGGDINVLTGRMAWQVGLAGCKGSTAHCSSHTRGCKVYKPRE